MIIGIRNINRVNLRLLTTSTGEDDMAKYSATTSLTAGAVTRVVTTITQEPYSIMITDSTGNIMNPPIVTAQIVFSGGVYNLDIYSTDALTNVNVKILY